jgi:hypothetical protein
VFLNRIGLGDQLVVEWPVYCLNFLASLWALVSTQPQKQ